MKLTLALLSLAAAVSAQGAGESTVSDTFNIIPLNFSTAAVYPKSLTGQACSSIPIVKLQGGVLTDQQGRTGEIVANHQFQFDVVIQSGAINTSGFSRLGNGSLALNGNALFYRCLSGTFNNLYDQSQGEQCEPIVILAVLCGGQYASTSPTITHTSTIRTTPTLPPTITTTRPTTAVPNLATSLTKPTLPVSGLSSSSSSSTSTSTSSTATASTTLAVPFPAGNSTTPAGPTGTGSSNSTTGSNSTGSSTSATSGSGSSSTSGSSPSSTATTSPASSPSNGVDALAVGSQLLAVTLGFAAFALL